MEDITALLGRDDEMASPADKKFPRNITSRISCRRVLNIMVLLGFMFNYMLRVNLTIAIVTMVERNQTDEEVHVSECGGSHPQVALNVSSNSTVTKSSDDELQQTRFQWDEYMQNMILGSFFWGYICTELPGGRLAEIIGGRRVFGASMLVASIVTLLTPPAAYLSHIAVIVLRVILGFMLGATWPAIHPMTAQWIPPMERSKFIANMMASSLGAAITMPVCGFLIASLGWESVFYVTGAVGLVWSVAWFFLVYDSPAAHPRISYEERDYIEKAIGNTTKHGKAHAVPWRQLFTSGPVWAIIITHGTSVFGYFTVVNQLPTYMKYILDFKIKENGLLSSLPYLGKYIFAVLTSTLADYLRKSGKLSTTATRKVFTSAATLVPCALMAAQMFLGCDRVASVTIFTIALTINGAVTAGYLGNGLDIAPNFSGTIFGMANTLSSLGGFLASYMVGSLTFENQTYAQWRIVFGILAGTYALSGINYLILGSGELQTWNDPDRDRDRDTMANENGESIPLRKA